MIEIGVDIGQVAGAIATGSAAERWFIDIEKNSLFMISVNYQSDEEIQKAVDMITANQDNYIALPFLSHEEFLSVVDIYTRTLADNPNMAELLLQAVENKSSKGQIMQILNRETGRKKEFGEFFSERVQERAVAWLESQNIKLTK